MKKLTKLFKVDSSFQLIIIFIVFGITGSLSVILGKYVLIFIFDEQLLNSQFFWILKLIIIFPLYQILLIIIGTLFGQFSYFWNIEKKILARMGLIKSTRS